MSQSSTHSLQGGGKEPGGKARALVLTSEHKDKNTIIITFYWEIRMSQVQCKIFGMGNFILYKPQR